MFKSAVYHGNSFMGEVEIYPKNSYGGAWAPREIRISHLSPPSERCPPLAVLHTVAAAGLRFKMEFRAPQMPSNESPPPLSLLHATCLKENKTAVVPFGEEELHLVAMFSRKNLVQYACFWGFIVAPQLYNSCLVMLNRRCLGIVFDLDETLVVANTMRSFEDRIDALQRKISNETDPQRVTGMLAEIRCYQDDKSILKQYIENDQVAENGKVFKVQSETVPPLSDNHPTITRPVIRLQEKNIILTRVNPAIRDTSVLVRLRPAWEELRSYLTARGRKRFEVYVCTMAERDYALEMWRLLDPDFNLINSRELLDRIVCVKSGLRKSLLNVFRDGICHPKMALVIDDRLKVWDEKDQPRVHVVPAFAPYYAPQAEANNSVPILCVARNVACNVRGGFFKEFDEGLLPRISNVFYEDEMSDFPSAPDVGNYLFSDDDTPASNGSKDPLPFEGITDVEAEKRLKVPNLTIQAATPMVNNLDPRSIASLQHVMPSSGVVPVAVPQMVMPLPINQCSQPIPLGKPLGPTGFPEASLQSSPAREEGEVPESELDPDTRRRLLILQHGQDNRESPLPPPPPPPPPPFQLRPPLQVSVPTAQSSGGWFPLNKEISPRQHKRAPKEFPLESEALHFNKRRSQHSSFSRGVDNTIPLDRGINGNEQYPVQARWGDDRLRSNHTVSNYNSFTGKEMPVGKIASNPRDAHLESGWTMTKYAETPAGVLHEIAMKSEAKVEYRTAVSDSTELQFSVEIWFVGEKIGEGIAKTRKEARDQACEKSLKYLANKYLSDTLPDSAAVHGSLNKFYHTRENGFINDSNCFGYPTSSKNDMPVASTPEDSRLLDQRFEGSKRSLASISALKDLCTAEGFNLVFQSQPSVSESSANKGAVHAQVEIAGQILGKGIGKTWEEAKLQAAEEAHGTLKSMLGQFTQKHASSPRSLSTASKRSKAELSRILQRNILSSR